MNRPTIHFGCGQSFQLFDSARKFDLQLRMVGPDHPFCVHTPGLRDLLQQIPVERVRTGRVLFIGCDSHMLGGSDHQNPVFGPVFDCQCDLEQLALLGRPIHCHFKQAGQQARIDDDLDCPQLMTHLDPGPAKMFVVGIQQVMQCPIQA